MNAAQLDENLILRMAAGDGHAFRELYTQTAGTVYGFALSILRNREDAEDVMHDAFIKTYTGAVTYRPGGKPLSWILTIVRNLAYNKIRAGKVNEDSIIPIVMRRHILTACFCFLFPLLCLAQESMVAVSDSKLYLIPIEYRGGTTIGTISRLRDYPFSNYVLVTDEDRLFFEDLLSKTKKKKHFQQKLVYNCSLMYIDSSNTNHYLVVTDYRIIDLSNRIEYRVKDECQQQELLGFVARLQQMNENMVVQPDNS